jgi:predicted metal-dependent peptidase
MDYKKDLGRIKAKGMLKLNGFYASLLISIKCEFSKEDVTAYTDGLSITLGESFWDSLNDRQKLFLLLHEISHIILKHSLRASLLKFDKVNFKLWNMACDFFINLMLMDDNDFGVYEFIEGGCIDQAYRDMSSEEIYKILKDKGEDSSNSGGIGLDIKISKATGSPEAKVVIDNLVKTAVANSKGSYSSNCSFLDSMKMYFEPSVVDWRVSLSQYMQVLFKASKNYSRPNRRVAWNNKLILKSTKKEKKLGDLLIYMDVSGSCTQQDIIDMFSELHHIISKYKPDSIVFSTFNTSIQETFTINSVKDIPPNLEVSGGTAIQCVINHIDKHPNKVCLAVLMSDMQSVGFTKPKNTPLLMLVVNNPYYISNIGQVIYYKKDKI